MRSQRPSLVGRAILSVALLVGFYVIALAVAVALAWFPFTQPRFAGPVGVSSLVGAVVIAWSLLPRIDRFEAPGPELSRAKQPRLFEEIESVAAATKQAMPEHVYLVNDVTAFVAQRGGLMGFGSKRVLGVGLPLMYGLTVSEMRAVIAHEFGHFHGGDTKLGPWVCKARGAIERTIHNLVRSGNTGLHQPFLWYGKFFMRVTQSISRVQELAADRLAADIVGPKALADGLRKVSKLAPGFARFMQVEYVPVVNSGHRPELLAGFQRFLDQPNVVSALDKLGEFEENEREVNAYDSHPPLKQRIAALASVRRREPVRDTRRASELFDDLAGVELDLLTFLARGADVSAMPAIEWDDVCEKVMIPHWIASCRNQARGLKGVVAKDLAALSQNPNALHSRFRLPRGAGWKQRNEFAHGILDAAFSLALQRAGWKLSTQPGGAIIAQRDGETLTTFGLTDKLSRKKADAGEFVATCERLGIANLSLELPA